MDEILKICDTLLQLCLVVLAGLALSVWKKEIRGRDKYKFAKELLIYIRELRFQIYSKDRSWHQIFLNDIITDREKFYNDQLFKIGDEKAYFDHSIFGLLSHISTRSDILLPPQVRILIEGLSIKSATLIGHKKQYTYIHLDGVKKQKITHFDKTDRFTDDVYQLEELSIKEYFEKWDKLIIELQKYL